MQKGTVSKTHLITIRASHVNTGTIARQTWFPIISAKCQIQIDKLALAGDKFSQDKATQIRLALVRLDDLITLKEAISQPGVTSVDQENGGENMRKLSRADFSDLGTLIRYQSEKWTWYGPYPGANNPIDLKDEYDNDRTDRFDKLHSIQDAVNISYTNIFNLGFFKMHAYYGPLWGKTTMLAEFEHDMSAEQTPSGNLQY
ncbi:MULTISPECIES: hypothetical protein [unclassified Legionella]|uniref:hypothetical protein n=1 Tax=unclassified Legionella TaxID=2622702 RepID=UPI001E475E07|nr:hypothetical protein [Legionella sp. 31fI33]MCC5014396.1 hypothetical protein [Legionella sp. 31fI33]